MMYDLMNAQDTIEVVLKRSPIGFGIGVGESAAVEF